MDELRNVPLPTRYPAGKRELIFGAAILACGIFLWNSLIYGGMNLGFALGNIGVLGCSVGYLLACGCRPDWYSGSLLLFCVAIAGGFARSSDGFVVFVMLQFVLFAGNLGLCLMAGQNRRCPGGVTSVLDAPRACFKLGFGGLGASARGLADAWKNAGAAGKKSSAAILGLAAAVPVVAVMVFLLMRADAAFEGLMDRMPELEWREAFYSVLTGGFAAWVLYTRCLGLHCAEKPARKEGRRGGISAITVNIILGAVGATYCVYLLSQLAYFSGGLSGILPEGYTMAEYARRGFFEMGWLSAINLCLMCLGAGLVEKREKAPLATRLLCLCLGIVTLFLIGTASAKMVLYIRGYGLTRLRVLTEVIMVWLAVTTVLVSVWLFRPRLPYMKTVVLAALLLGTVTLWVDVDTQVARYNVRAYQSGRLETVDIAHLAGLGDGALPYIEELAHDEDPELAEWAMDILTYRSREVADFRGWNWSRAAAAEILDQYNEERRVPPC